MTLRTMVDRLAASPAVPRVAAAVSLVIGLAFIFVWAPHPWGWQGIDQYHQIAIELARGASFDTLDVPWGYGYFLAPFYRVVGPTPLPALLAQALLNATIPLMVFAYARRAFDRRIGAIAALLVGVLSFNTVYVSTESTDSVSTTLFMAMLLSFVRGRESNHLRWFLAAGVCGGIVAQFRPKLVLLPFVFGALNWLLGPRTMRRAAQGGAIAVVAVLLLVPWTWRNYQLTRQFLPTSTHGGIQLWYGTLQAGPYIESRAHNPRSVFATSPFDYTSLLHVPIDIDVWMNCGPGSPESVVFAYRLDRGPIQRLPLQPAGNGHYVGAVPAVDREARVYYFTEVTWPAGVAPPPVHVTPAGGATDSHVYFVSDRHTADLDVDEALLDVFDVARVMRHLAWGEAMRGGDRLDVDRDGRVDEGDLRGVLRMMLLGMDRGEPPTDRLREFAFDANRAWLRFTDGSELAVPRAWHERLTDLAIGTGAAENLLATRYRYTQPDPEPKLPLEVQCLGPGGIAINAAYYRQQPHEQRRYMALALDNISRGPVDYAWSVLYRAVRLFVIVGTEDRGTAQQFDRSRIVYSAATVVSALYLLLAAIGTWIGWRRGYAVALPLALILYIPATIAFVLTNMRYTTTVQPLMLTFVAVTVVAAVDRVKSGGRE
ncbi:MAG: glycosyltransferase family 39 protein [Acidimicrobiia bacterium]